MRNPAGILDYPHVQVLLYGIVREILLPWIGTWSGHQATNNHGWADLVLNNSARMLGIIMETEHGKGQRMAKGESV
jgi:hypothetical protein